jgi:hypothetical protein
MPGAHCLQARLDAEKETAARQAGDAKAAATNDAAAQLAWEACRYNFVPIKTREHEHMDPRWTAEAREVRRMGRLGRTLPRSVLHFAP